MTDGRTNAQPVAFFDLDGTLTRGDTLLYWVAELVGWPRAMATFATALGPRRTEAASQAADWRGRLKCKFLERAIGGIDAERAAAAGHAVRRRIKWRAPLLDALRAHHGLGHRIVVVTGAPSLYLPGLLDGLPINEALGAELEVQDGKLTGRLASFNPVRAAKAKRLRAWLAEHGPIGESWGYGNAPHDLPMLALVDHAIIV